MLGLAKFDEDDLYDALDDLAERQEKIEQALYRCYLRQQKNPPRLFLYDVTSSYLEGEHNESGAFGYNRDGKRGKLQIVIGLLTDEQGEPLAVRVFEGNSADPATVADQIKILQEQFQVMELIFVGDRGMVKSKGKQALHHAQLHYITALTDPRIRRLLGEGILQLPLFSETICEVEHEQLRYVLRKNESENTRIQRRLTDKLEKLEVRIQSRNQKVQPQPLCKPEAGFHPSDKDPSLGTPGLHQIELWAKRHKLEELIQLRLEGGQIAIEPQQQAMARRLELAGCYVITTDVAGAEMDAQHVHDSYMALQRVEQNFRAMKTGALEVRPIFVQKASRTRGHVLCCMVALKLVREMEQRLRAAFGTTGDNPHAVTLPDAMAALSRLCLLNYPVSKSGEVVTKLPYGRDVTAVAVECFINKWEALVVYDQRDHQLLAVGPMIRRVAAANHGILFRRAFHICAGQIVEEHVELGSEQRAVALFQMPFQLRLVGKNAVQAAIQSRVVDLAFFDLQQIVQRRRRIPALLDGQFAARRAQTVDGQQRGYARLGHIGRFLIDALFKETIQFKPLPQLQSEVAGAERTRPLQTHFVQQHTRHLRIVIRGHNMRREQLQLQRIALLVEDLNRLHPARMRRTVQLTQIADRPLTTTIRRAHRFHPRPVRVSLPVFAAAVRTQIHSAKIVPRRKPDFKRVGLHYIVFSDSKLEQKGVGFRQLTKIARNAHFVTNLGSERSLSPPRYPAKNKLPQ